MTDLCFEIHDVLPYINWQYFFHAWGLPARFGSIASVCSCPACRQEWLRQQSIIYKNARTLFNKPFATSGSSADESSHKNVAQAEEAWHLYEDAQSLLRQLDGHFRTHARVAIFEARSQADDILLFPPAGDGIFASAGKSPEFVLPFLRQQHPGIDGFCHCLSDFVFPVGREVPAEIRGIYDHIGLFATTVDAEMEQASPEDDYLHLLHQTLADRLAEATAEKVHEEVRQHIWGYAPMERFSNEQLFQEAYQGIRPAVGYPSMPDQSFNFLLDELLHLSDIHITLTESGAMRPHASTIGLMLAHPAARHFSVGSIAEDQLVDYARRRGLPPDMLRRFLHIDK